MTKFTECREGKIELCWGLDFLLFPERRAIDADYLCIEGKIIKKKNQNKTTDYLLRAEGGHNLL